MTDGVGTASSCFPLFVVLPEILYTGGYCACCIPLHSLSSSIPSFFSGLLFFMECLDSQVLLLLERREMGMLLMLDFLCLCVCVCVFLFYC